MRITRLTIRNYAGIASADIAVPPAGILIKGGNARGKTSIVRALRAALQARGVDAGCIHQGADKSEILVDMEALHAQRTIREKKTDLVVTNQSGMVQPKPQTILNELFGKEVDPLAFYLAKDDERRRMIYQVMPMEVTASDICRWTGETTPGSFIGHGLEVLAGIRQRYYDKRTTANAAAEDSKRRADELRAKAEAMGSPSSAVSAADAAQLLAETQRELNELTGRQSAYRQAREAAGPTLAKIEEMRYRAAESKTFPLSYSYPSFPEIVFPDEDSLCRQMQADRGRLDAMNADLESVRKGRRLLNEARDLETSLAGIDSMAVPQEELDAASKRVRDAASALAQANLAEDYQKARAAADAARVQAVKDLDEAGRLDQVVRTLTSDAPRELAARSNAIPGLEVAQKITLDGVAIDEKSGKEQMQFAVDLAKRVRGEGRVMTIDGTEKLDEDELPGFLQMAVAGGWQVIATRVTKGPLEITIISEEEAA